MCSSDLGNPANPRSPHSPPFPANAPMTQPQPASQSDTVAASGTTPEKTPGGPVVTDATAAALGRIPSGLFVVTWRGREDDAAAQDRAMLASWVMQGGFVPPLITIAVGTSRDLLAAIDQCTPFVVNVLGESQRSLLARFGRPAARSEEHTSELQSTQ